MRKYLCRCINSQKLITGIFGAMKGVITIKWILKEYALVDV